MEQQLSQILDKIINIEEKVNKIDNRLITVEQNVNHINNRLKKIDNEMDILKNEMDILKKDVKNNIITINSHIKSNALKLEKDLGESLVEHFHKTIPNPYFQKIDSFKFYDCDDNIITDIDFAAFIKISMQNSNHIFDKNKTKHSENIEFFTIIEAKSKITKDKIVEKIYQLYKIKTIIENLNTIDLSRCQKQFNSMVTNFKLHNYIELKNIDVNKILFYVGGHNWNDNKAEEFIQSIRKSDNVEIRKLSQQCIAQLKVSDVTEDDFYKMLKFLQYKIGTIKSNGNKYIFDDNYSVESANTGGKRNPKKFLSKKNVKNNVI